MLLAAARALAAVVADDELNPAYIVPSVFHPDVTRVVAQAVERAARASSDVPLPDPGGPLHDIGGHPQHPDWHGPQGPQDALAGQPS
jgi:malate dehydrogenase (oxaloacetate-decarboxylating)